jgi:hypothetical protein
MVLEIILSDGEFYGSVDSHDKHTPFTLEESGPPRMTYACESQ